MTVIVVLLLFALGYAAYQNRDKIQEFVRSHIKTVSPDKAQDPAPSGKAPEMAPPVASEATNVAKPNTGSDNWLTRSIASQAGPQVEYKDVPHGEWYSTMPAKSGVVYVPPEWWQGGGFVRLIGNAEIHFQGATKPYDVLVNATPDTKPGQVTTVNGVSTTPVASAIHCGVVDPVAGEILVRVSQDGGCVVQLQG